METQIFFETGGERVLLTSRDRLMVRAGETIDVRFPPEHAHIFHLDTGERLKPTGTVVDGATQ